MLKNVLDLVVDSLSKTGAKAWVKNSVSGHKQWTDNSTTIGYTSLLHSFYPTFSTIVSAIFPSVNQGFYTLYPALINKTVY